MDLKKSMFTPFLILSITLTCNVNSLLSMEEKDEEKTPSLAHTGGGTLPLKFLWGASTCTGRKPKMEDTYTALPAFNGDASAFFAVYDGHSGDQASQYAAANLHAFFSTRLHAEKSIPASLNDAFETTNTNIPDNSGTTATVAFIDRDQFLHTAWVGDSRFIVARGGNVMYQTEDHKPSNERERARIELRGGQTHTLGGKVPRIGGLMVSRTLGDRAIKASSAMGVKEGVIISTPQIMCLKFEDTDVGVIASDGLWEVASSPEVADLLDKLLKRKTTVTSESETEDKGNDEQLKQLARQLCVYAFAKNSRDNIAVLLFRMASGAPEEKQPGLKERLASKLWKQK